MELKKKKVNNTDDNSGNEDELGEQLENTLRYIQLLEEVNKKLCKVIARSIYRNKAISKSDLLTLDDEDIVTIEKEYDTLTDELEEM